MAARAETDKEAGREFRAVARYVRVSPQKARQVISLVRERPVNDALNMLEFTPKAGARILTKLINSAVANAERQGHVSRNQLYLSSLYADDGPTLKRWRPRAMGRIGRISKRTSHITVVLSTSKEGS